MNGTEQARQHPEWVTGAIAKDRAGRVGRVMGEWAGVVYLRPLNGGKEWSAPAVELEPAAQPDALSEALAEANTSKRMRERM